MRIPEKLLGEGSDGAVSGSAAIPGNGRAVLVRGIDGLTNRALPAVCSDQSAEPCLLSALSSQQSPPVVCAERSPASDCRASPQQARAPRPRLLWSKASWHVSAGMVGRAHGAHVGKGAAGWHWGGPEGRAWQAPWEYAPSNMQAHVGHDVCPGDSAVARRAASQSSLRCHFPFGLLWWLRW